MKRTHGIIALLIALIFTLSACCCVNSNIGTVDQGVVNDTEFNDYSFWMRENQVRILLPITGVHIEETSDEFATNIENTQLDLTNRQIATIEELKAGIADYFSEAYDIDVSEQLERQQVRGYESKDGKSQSIQGVLGYVDVNEPNVLNLHTSILTGEQKYLFETVYVHETLHQIGFRAPEGKQQSYLYEGITDALTDIIMKYMGKTAILTPTYATMRSFGYQMLKVDSELPGLFIKNNGYNVFDRVNARLENVKQPFLQEKLVGNFMATMIEVVHGIENGMASGTNDPYIYIFQVQEIVRAYAQTFNPEEATIAYLRQHYIITDYEEQDFTWEDGENMNIKFK